MSRADSQLKIRLPLEERRFIEQAATRNGSSLSFEVLRSIRERMERQNAERPAAPTADRSKTNPENP